MQPPHVTRPARRLSKAELSILTSSINATLLHCAAILAENDPPGTRSPTSAASVPYLSFALSLADTALAVAGRHHLPELVAKAHLFQGHCLRRTGRWRGAHAAYVRAASVRSFAADEGPAGLAALTAECAARAEEEEGKAETRDRDEAKRRRKNTGSGSVGGGISVMLPAYGGFDEVDWLAFGDDRGEQSQPTRELTYPGGDCEVISSRKLARDGRRDLVAHREQPQRLRKVKGRSFDNLFSAGS